MSKIALAALALLLAGSMYVPAGAVVTGGEMSIVTSDTVDADNQTAARRGRRRRVPGGSGCDDPEDIAEHPECSR
jgi:hypothetical protein